MKVDKNVVWGGVVVFLSLIGAITYLVSQGKDYQGIMLLLSSVAVLAGQAANLIKTHATEVKVADVQEKVNGRMSELIQAKTTTDEDTSNGSTGPTG